MTTADDTDLDERVTAALDSLLAALDLDAVGPNRFRGSAGPGRLFGRVFGGQLLAQALVAAGRTVTGMSPASLHAIFVAAGTPSVPFEIQVERVRDERSMAARQVSVRQGEQTLLTALVSFHHNPTEPDDTPPAPTAPPPHVLPRLQVWAQRLLDDGIETGRAWIEHPIPLDVRTPEAPAFMGGRGSSAPRSHYLRLPRDVGDDGLLHSALLAYASDLLLLDVVFRGHPAGPGIGRFFGTSLDHAIWFHRVPRFDRWHLYTQESLGVVGERGLARGSLHDADGRLVASSTQEVLVRPMEAR